MRFSRLRLPVALAAAALATGLLAATSIAASPTVTVRLSAKAGPVTMHADLTVIGVRSATAKAVGSLSSCAVQPVSKPRSGIADRIVCTSVSGKKAIVALAPTTATLGYRLETRASLQGATVEIRQKASVLATLSASGGTITMPLRDTAALLAGHDTLYVQIGAHTYRAAIRQVH